MSGFYEAFYQLCRDKIPGFLFDEIKSAAIPASGAAARWRGPGATTFERIAIHDLAPDKLKNVEGKELKSVLGRINKIFQTAKRAKEDVTPYHKAAALVVREMRDRKMNVDAKLAVLQEFIGKSEEEVAKYLDPIPPYSPAAEFGPVAPTSHRGYTVQETLQLVKESGRFSQEDANYNPRSPHGWHTCSSCRFFVRGEGPTGSCQAIEGTVNWFGISDLYIAASDEAGYVFHEAERAVHDEMMDSALDSIVKAGDMGTDDDNNTDPKEPEIVITTKELVKKRIKREGDEYLVTDEAGDKILGRHGNKADAIRQLAAIEARQRAVEKAQPTVAAVGDMSTPARSKETDEDLKRLNAGNDEEEEEEAAAVTKDAVQFDIPIAKVDGEQQKIYGIVLEPDMVDTQGDTMTAAEIEKAAETFMKSRIIGDGHKKAAHNVELTDSYVAQGPTKIGNKSVKKGTWIIGVKVLDHGLWTRIKNGEYTGFSVGGRGNRIKMA